jgi:hypothetical protein
MQLSEQVTDYSANTPELRIECNTPAQSTATGPAAAARTLNHEVPDHTVEAAALEAKALLASAQRTEVLHSTAQHSMTHHHRSCQHSIGRNDNGEQHPCLMTCIPCHDLWLAVL